MKLALLLFACCRFTVLCDYDHRIGEACAHGCSVNYACPGKVYCDAHVRFKGNGKVDCSGVPHA